MAQLFAEVARGKTADSFNRCNPFCRDIGILLRAGIPLMSSFDIVNMVVGNEVFREGLRQVMKWPGWAAGYLPPGATGLISGYVDSDDQSREESGL